MLDWLKNINKDYPEFWKTYLSKFDKKSKRYVVLSTETSGLNLHLDVIFSISAFAVVDDNILIGDNFETILLQYKYFHENKIFNEFILESKMPKQGETEAITNFIEYLGNAVIVGHHVDFDVEMINIALEKMGCGRLKNEALDIDIMYRKLNDITDKDFSLDELSDAFKIPVSDRNSSAHEAYRIALLFLKLKSRLGLK
ncbi:3'-5' exonuclease [Flavobacterium muglaense]|uniref:3'-5' exonuclease n=1 Tax=Flavobacterium muglaense TaxID=2764716 RepID=A0A923N371_9FLAO|nr:3'-5' exonuclease [Flavobacterium muglaense]MBC5838743.1 3'-5' exonuclease [Flavobacterium muglaense]MBC5845225.1 3'-5' exonuclease [Flavobacterium muglaense]